MAIKRKKQPNKLMTWVNARPARLILFSFFLVILIGTSLLMLPYASADRQSIGLLRALFTATSATCVTGLVVVDTATHWSVFGKGVILALFQIGGLGIVTITSFFYSIMRRKASLKTMVVTQASTANFGFNDVMRLVRRIVLITFTIELTGGLLISWRLASRYGWLTGIQKGFFQSVSAFCNAGFDVHGDTASGPFSSLTAWNDDPFLLLVTGLLIIIGGLGFVVWNDLLSFRKNRKLNFHSKVVLTMTGIFLFIGTLFFYFTEAGNQSHSLSMGSLPQIQRTIAAFFQSLTTRTAGFNTIDQHSLTDSSKFMTIFMMFVGAAPGSTGGGIKITTFAVIIATILSDIQSREDIVLFRHRLARETFTRAFAIMGLAMTIVLTGSMLLTFTERTAIEAGDLSFIDLFFETVSAFATVGLSAAGTPDLQPASWAILTPIMFMGRVGPVSFAIGLAMKSNIQRDIVHPEGRTLVG